MKVKKIAIITMGVALPEEKGYSRFRFLAEFLVEKGFEVDLITSSFQHWEKKHRILTDWDDNNLPYGVHFIEEPGYKKNIDLRRIYSHHIAAKNITKFLGNHEEYDLIYAEVPPNDVALAIGIYAKKKNVPFVIDVNDLWPEAMKMVLDITIVSDVMFYPLLRDVEKVYSMVSGVVGTSDEYRDRPFKYQDRNIPRITVYVGNELAEFDAGVVEFGSQINKPESEYWVTYAGTLGKSYDISTMISASAELKKRGYENIKIKILGGGPTESELKKQAENLDCTVEFLGYMPYKKMAAYLDKSNILVNSVVKKSAASIITKIGDYLAAQKPMLNTGTSKEFCEKVYKDGFGINIEAESTVALVNGILELYKSKDRCEVMGNISREVAEREFDRKNSYVGIVQMINLLINNAKKEEEEECIVKI